MFPEESLAVPLYFLLGIYSRDNKGEVLEVGDKLLIYIQHAGRDSPRGPQLHTQPEVSEASRAALLLRGHLLLVEKGKCTGHIVED